MRRNLLLAAIVFSLAFFVFPSLILKSEARGDERETRIKQKVEKMEMDREDRIATLSAKRKERLDNNKEKVCEIKKANIIRRSKSAADMAAKQFRSFDTIAQRVDTFYLTKVVPKGITIASYSALKADIAEKRALAVASLNDASASANTLDCKADNPKVQMQIFKDDMHAVIKALKNYRTSIRNFIVAVKSAVGKAESSATKSSKSE